MILPPYANDEIYLYEKRVCFFLILACYVYCGVKSRFTYNR